MHTLRILGTSVLALLGGALAQTPNYDPSRSLNIGVILFPGFQPIDVIGPMDIMFGLSRLINMTVVYIWKEVGPVSAVPPPRLFPPPNLPPTLFPVQAPSFMATHSFANAPPLDIILVPGGGGNRVLHDYDDTVIEDFIRERYPSLTYLLSVCTGSASIAKSGVLDGRVATTNKLAWSWATQFGNGVQWVPSARWAVDGNIWTSSGVSAGLDMTYAFFKMLLGPQKANQVVNGMEYAPHTNIDWDPYSVVHNVPGADLTRPLGECVGPAGYDFHCAV